MVKCRQAKQKGIPAMYPSYESILPLGDLGSRLALLYGRMSAPIYRPDRIFTIEQSGWPGDWEGRTLLAQTLLSRAMHREHPYLKLNFDAISSHLNEKGYMKHILPDGEFDEQQLSGHGWLLRGLCEYREYSRDEAALAMAKRIFENLFLPLTDRMDSYPAGRTRGGAASGNIAAVIDGWHLSTDTGCVFIPMDGISRYLEISGDARAEKLLRQMIGRFAGLDLLALKAQTHASLSAVRGILRLYKLTGDRELMDIAARVFDLYEKSGMTAAFANCNWFDRPEWTEPCAIIDSFIVAMRLFEYTNEPRYALFARKVYYNAVCRSQRDNGGFGGDNCPGWENGGGDFLKTAFYEAFWCCTMRGGEGLPMAARFIADEKDGCLRILLPVSAEVSVSSASGSVRARLNGESARDGVLTVRVLENTLPAHAKVRLLLPDGGFAEEELPAAGGSVRFAWDTPLRLEKRRLMWGEIMLGSENAPAEIDVSALSRTAEGFEGENAKFVPLADSLYLENGSKVLRVLFDGR